MPRISTDNYDTVASWNGSQDLFVVEQTGGTKVATPEQIKQYVLNDMDEVPTQNSNNPVKSGGIFSAVDDVYSVMGQMGAKNLIPYPYADGEEKSQNNMTYTVNTDGTITATATQALTNDATFYLYGPTGTEELVLKAGVKYVLSGDPTASGVERIVVAGRSAAGGTSETLIINNYGVPKEYTPDVDKVITSIYIRIYAGPSSPIPYNQTFKPMLRLASDTDNTYQPYAKTNKQLTDDVTAISLNKRGAGINLATDYYRTKYTTPTDGYIVAESTAINAMATGLIYGANDEYIAQVTAMMHANSGGYETASLYVKKGMKVSAYRCDESASITFYPLTN